MRDTSLDSARELIAQAGEMASGEAISALFTHYNVSPPSARDAFVLALIGDLVAVQQCSAHRRRAEMDRPQGAAA